MEVYLPVVEVQINIILILFVSFVIGFLSGLFGVGGGFLMTPFLIFMGIPPAFAVANEANNILASSTSGTLTHWFKKTMDLKIGWLIMVILQKKISTKWLWVLVMFYRKAHIS